MRRGVQLSFLALFSGLFVFNSSGERIPLPADLFLRLDPLLAVAGSLASRQLHINLLWALPLLLSAVLAGRFFCGYVCPLGTLFDLSGKRSPRQKNFPLSRGPYYILVFVLACSVLGIAAAGLFDPLAFLTRVYTFFLYPLTVGLSNLGIDLVRPAADYLSLQYLAHAHYSQPYFSLNFITVLLCTALLYLNVKAHRFWCRYLCPLGGLLGLVARLGMIKRRVGSTCTRCMQCRAACPMDAVDPDPHLTREEACIQCATCSYVCPERAVTFRVLPSRLFHDRPRLNLSKRAFIVAAGAGAVAVISQRTDTAARMATGMLIRPPGALPEELFLDLCVRCGQCMKVCPTNTLQPCLLESGIAGIWSPRLMPRLAACDQTCRLCGTVCPTQAVRELTLEEKKHAKLGTAFIDRSRCLVWVQDRLCLICDEQCPYNAIVFRWEQGFRRPFVVETSCNGCGLCEKACPVAGAAAIQVTIQGQIRLAGGSYIEKAQQLRLELKEDRGDDSFLEAGDAPQPPSETPQLPKGFVVE